MTENRAKDAAGADALGRFAAGKAGTTESIACAGTALESRRFSVGKNAFLFVGPKSVMLKLSRGHAAATRLAKAEPERYRFGATGWVTVVRDGTPLPLAVLKGWVAESHAACGGGAPAPVKKPRATAKTKRSAGRA